MFVQLLPKALKSGTPVVHGNREYSVYEAAPEEICLITVEKNVVKFERWGLVEGVVQIDGLQSFARGIEKR